MYYNQQYARDPKRWIGDLYNLLNRTDVFAEFTRESSVGLQWAAPRDDEYIGIWNFLRQIIVARELAVRLKHLDGDSSYAGFTARVLASLIVSDLWLKHTEIIITDTKLQIDGAEKVASDEERAQAEDFKNKGNDAMRDKAYEVAFEYYTKAAKIDVGNAVYRCNRSAALLELQNYEEAEGDAFLATQLDPKYAKAWSRLGMALFKQGYFKRARKAYERALHVAGNGATQQMRQGLADAKAKLEEAVAAIESETDRERQHKLQSDLLDEDWEIIGRVPEVHSLIHEQQVEGLLLFAEQMKWPYINEVRDYAEDVYSNIRGGSTVNIHLHDWLFGVILPGKWFAFKIMTALVLCTPSIKDRIGVSPYYDCGLSLPTRSYWRARTVLGRVLGCLPGVTGLCGWIGPCPPIELDPPEEGGKKPRHVRVKARRIAPIDHRPNRDDGVIDLGSGYDRFEATRIRPGEEMDAYLADMKDPGKWIVPEAPVQQTGACEIKAI